MAKWPYPQLGNIGENWEEMPRKTGGEVIVCRDGPGARVLVEPVQIDENDVRPNDTVVVLGIDFTPIGYPRRLNISLTRSEANEISMALGMAVNKGYRLKRDHSDE